MDAAFKDFGLNLVVTRVGLHYSVHREPSMNSSKLPPVPVGGYFNPLKFSRFFQKIVGTSIHSLITIMILNVPVETIPSFPGVMILSWKSTSGFQVIIYGPESKCVDKIVAISKLEEHLEQTGTTGPKVSFSGFIKTIRFPIANQSLYLAATVHKPEPPFDVLDCQFCYENPYGYMRMYPSNFLKVLDEEGEAGLDKMKKYVDQTLGKILTNDMVILHSNEDIAKVMQMITDNFEAKKKLKSK